MEPNISDAEIAKDVLHNPEHSKLTQEEIAKALAHHKKHHPKEQQNAKKPQGQNREAAK